MSGVLGGVSNILNRMQMRPASFRGVGFGVMSRGKGFGRHVITHRFPLRDRVLHEDMGAKERVIEVEAFLAGTTARSRLLVLEAALSKRGAGRLVHPDYGELQVVVTSARTNAALETGLYSLSITFEIDDTEAKAPISKTNGPSLLDRLGLSAVAELVEEYGRLLTLDGLQDFVAEQLGDLLGDLGVSVGDLASVYGVYQQVAGAVGLLGAFVGGGGGSGGLTAATSSKAITAAVEGLAPLGRRPDAALALAASGVALPAPALISTPSRRAAAQNATAVAELARGAAAAHAARSGAAVVWDSRDEAIRYRDRVADALDGAGDRVGALGWDASWRALTDLRAAWVEHVNSTAASLPQIRIITLATPMSALELAYQLDGDDLAKLFARADDIVRRNRIANAAFLPIGVPLEVLTDAG